MQSGEIIPIVDFPLQLYSKDQLSLGDGHEVFSNFLTEEYKQHLKLLKLAASSSTSKEKLLNLGQVTPDVLNRLDRSQGASPLHYASMHGNLAVVTYLLENGADPDILDDNKMVTPLSCASAYGHLNVVELLISHNCDVNAGLNNVSPDQRPPLIWAVKMNLPEIVRCLLDNNASQNSPILYSETAVHASVITGNPDILEMLLSAQGKDVKADFHMGDEKDTPLHLACGQYPNSLEICRILVEQANVAVNAVNSIDKTPLHVAAQCQNSEVVKFLLSHWAKINAVDSQGKTPLFYAIGDSKHALECIETLIIKGKCDVNHHDNQGNTPLHVAAISGTGCAAEILMINGADFSIKSGNTSALALLRRKIPDINEILNRVFDHAVSVTNFPESGATETRHDCKVKVNYKYILPSTPNQSSVVSPSEEQQIKRDGTGGPRMAFLFKSGEVDEKGLQSIAKRKETAKVKCLVDEDLACILVHPVIHSFLELKWNKARRIFFPTLIFKAILVLLFSCYVQLPYVYNGRLIGTQNMAIPIASFNPIKNETKMNNVTTMMTSNATMMIKNNVTMMAMKNNATMMMMMRNSTMRESRVSPVAPAVIPLTPPLWFTVMYIIIVTMAVVKGLMEILQIVRSPKTQLRTIHPWISLAVLVIMFYYMRPRIWNKSADPLRRSVAALGILLSWVDIWIDMGRFPKVGLSIRVFFQVFRNFAFFMMPHFCLLAGFILAFTLLLPQNGEFASVTFTLTKIIRIMAGDITISSEGMRLQTVETPIREVLAHVLLVYIYTAYVLIVAIVLGNLLIGLAVNDIQGIYASAAVDKLAKQTILINTLETNFGGKWTRNWLPKGLLSKYTNLFQPSSQNKILTFKPCDSRDTKLSKDQKKALLKIANNTKIEDSMKSDTEEIQDSARVTSKHIRQWKLAVNQARKSGHPDEQKILMEKINELLTTFIAEKKPKT